METEQDSLRFVIPKAFVLFHQIDPYVRLKWEPWLLGNARYEGFYVEVLEEVARRAGLEYQLRLVADGQIGAMGDDGSWNGLIGEVATGVSIHNFVN